MKRTINYSKKGFTLVETMCTVAIGVILLSVTALGISDHLSNTHKTAQLVVRSRSNLDLIEDEVYGGTSGASVSSTANGKASQSAIGGNGGGTSGGGSSISREDSVKPAAAEAAEQEAEEARHDEVTNLAESISAYAETHGVTYLPGTENLPNILAAGELAARDLYEEGGYTDPRYFTYNPATGKISLANGTGKNFECRDGQNMIKASLDEAVAASTPGCNVRSLMDSSFLNSSKSNIYIGVKKNEDGTYQIVPNVCIDVNGNFNSIITFNFGNGTGTVNRNTFNANNPPKNWDGYVAYVTNAGGEMIDLSKADLSNYTTRRSTSAQNKEWMTYVQSLRTAYQ